MQNTVWRVGFDPQYVQSVQPLKHIRYLRKKWQPGVLSCQKTYISLTCAAGAVFLSRALFVPPCRFFLTACVFVCENRETAVCFYLRNSERRVAVKWQINSAFAHLQIIGGGAKRERSHRRFYFRVQRSLGGFMRSFNRTWGSRPASRRGGETTLEPLLNIARDNLPGEKTRPEGDKFKWKSATRRVDDAGNKTRAMRSSSRWRFNNWNNCVQHISGKFCNGSLSWAAPCALLMRCCVVAHAAVNTNLCQLFVVIASARNLAFTSQYVMKEFREQVQNLLSRAAHLNARREVPGWGN